ncbi:16635_t:CDS:2, partial [Dentiscutata heterogama]
QILAQKRYLVTSISQISSMIVLISFAVLAVILSLCNMDDNKYNNEYDKKYNSKYNEKYNNKYNNKYYKDSKEENNEYNKKYDNYGYDNKEYNEGYNEECSEEFSEEFNITLTKVICIDIILIKLVSFVLFMIYCKENQHIYFLLKPSNGILGYQYDLKNLLLWMYKDYITAIEYLNRSLHKHEVQERGRVLI